MTLPAKRRPFGTAAANAAVHRERNSAGHVKKSQPKPIAPPTSKPKHTSRDDKRRNSKTPKMHNLSSVGGAYSFNANFKSVRRDVMVKKPPKHKPDPSPVKRPDPSSKITDAKECAASGYKSSKKDEAKVVAAPKPKPQSATAFNQPGQSATVTTKSSMKTFKQRDELDASVNGDLFKSILPAIAIGSVAASCRSERDASSDMDVDSDFSSPERTSPLVKSPYNRPDPEPTASQWSAGNATELADKQTPTKAAQTTLHVKEVLEEALARARDGPADNKRVLDAMLNSSNAKLNDHRIDASQTEASGPSLVGSMISLQRSASVDGSEVTMPDISFASEMNSSSILRTSMNDVSSANFLRHPTADERAMLSMQIASQLHSEYTYPSQIHLPAGWQVRLSKSKGKPYYVHPDFGSTWHYPGLVVGPHIAVQNKLCMDQNVDVSAFKSLDSSNAMQSIAADNLKNTNSTQETNVEEHLEADNHADLVSSAGKRSDDAVVPNEYVGSKDAFSNASESKCLTQDSFVTSKNEQTSASVGSQLEDVTIDVNTTAELKDTRSSKTEVTELKTGQYQMNGSNRGDDCGYDDVCIENESNQSQTEGDRNNVEFGTEQDNNFDSFHEDGMSDEEVATPISAESQDDSLTASNGHSNDETLYIIDTNKRDSTSSIQSDHVDVNRMLALSPLATIREIMRESSGKLSRHSSKISLGSLGGGSSRGEESEHDGDLLDESSQVSKVGSLGSTSQTFLSHSFDADDFGGFNVGGGFSDDEGIPAKHGTLDDHKETSTKLTKKKSRKLPPLKRERRKTFPPGPLCSLQLLEIIEEGALDTPLWRNGSKRKRTTLSSIKRARESKKARRTSI